MKRSIKGLRGRERGQVLMVTALLVTGMLGFLGLVVDGGRAYSERRQAQNASDQAAMAAATVLKEGGSDAEAISAALGYAVAHGYSADAVTVHIPPTSGEWAGNGDFAEVTIEDEPATLFIHVVTPDGSLVRGRGVAGTVISGTYAIYSAPGCQGDANMNGKVHFEGQNAFVDGGVHGDWIDAEEDDMTVTGSTTYVCTLDGESDAPGFAAGPSQVGSTPPPPVSFEYGDFNCDYSVTGNMRINDASHWYVNNNPSTKTLKPGVYCATGNIITEDAGLQGNVTFVAHGDIEIQAGGFNFTAFQHNVVMFTDATNNMGHIAPEVEIEGSNGRLSGMIIAPFGEIELEGSGTIIENTLLYGGHQVHLEGNNLQITGASDVGSRAVALVE